MSFAVLYSAGLDSKTSKTESPREQNLDGVDSFKKHTETVRYLVPKIQSYNQVHLSRPVNEISERASRTSVW